MSVENARKQVDQGPGDFTPSGNEPKCQQLVKPVCTSHGPPWIPVPYDHRGYDHPQLTIIDYIVCNA